MSLSFFPKVESSDLNSDEKFSEDTEENLWLDILNEVECSPNKLPSCKNLLLLGDNGSGKASLIAKLQGSTHKNPHKGHGLQYEYVFLRDEYRDDQARLGAYILDGDFAHRSLLKYVINANTLCNTTVLLVSSMAEPWNIIESLNNWADVLEEHIRNLRLPEDVLNEHRNRISKKFEENIDIQIEGGNATLPSREISVNLGCEIIVVITNSDKIPELQKEFDYKEEHFEFIQITIRNFCLKYGAALFYVSNKENRNCDVLLKYISHRIFSFPFRNSASILERDLLFIPAGWDNHNKVNINIDNLTSISANHPYNEVIVKPISRKPVSKEIEIVSEGDEEFLFKVQSLLNQQAPANVGRPVNTQETPIRSQGVQKTADRRISGSPSVSSPKNAKIDGKAGSMGGEGVLQNFFNSLLNRKSGAHTSPIAGGLSMRSPSDKSARQDAAAELDRMSLSKKPTYNQDTVSQDDQEEKQVQS